MPTIHQSTRGPEPIVVVPAASGSFERNLQHLQQSIAKVAYNKAESRGFEPGHELEDWISAETELFRAVPVEITEGEDEIAIVAEVPGCAPNDIDIHLEPTRVVIGGGGAKPDAQAVGEVRYSERDVASNQVKRIFRAVYLPQPVDPERATASLTSGVLKLKLPKLPVTEQKRVQVKAVPEPPAATRPTDPVNRHQGGRMTPGDPADQHHTPHGS